MPNFPYTRMSKAALLNLSGTLQDSLNLMELYGLQPQCSTLTFFAHGSRRLWRIYMLILDVSAEKPLIHYIPKDNHTQAAAIFGIEYHRLAAKEQLPGFSMDVQLCQLTLAAAPGDPVIWLAIETIVTNIRKLAEV